MAALVIGAYLRETPVPNVGAIVSSGRSTPSGWDSAVRSRPMRAPIVVGVRAPSAIAARIEWVHGTVAEARILLQPFGPQVIAPAGSPPQ